MKVAQYLYYDKFNMIFKISDAFYVDDKTFRLSKHVNEKEYWRLKNTEIETNDFMPITLEQDFESDDVEEVIYSEQYKNIPVTKLKYQYEWRYQKSMLWFITPEKFESDDEFKNYIGKAVVLDLIDFRRFVKPAHKEIGI